MVIFGLALSDELSCAKAEETISDQFLTPIATNSVEASRFQLIERAALPSNYSSLTSIAGKPLLIEVGPEITKAVLVGRNVSFDFDKGASTTEVQELIELICHQVPYSGWRENSAKLSDKFGSLWDELRKVPPVDEPSVERTFMIDYYTLKIYVRNRLSQERRQKIDISLCVTDMPSLELRAKKSLREDSHLWEAPVNNRTGIYEPAADSFPAPFSNYLEWLEHAVASGDFFKGQILQIEASFPILIRHAAPRENTGWCLMIAEQHREAENRSHLVDSVKATLVQRMDKANIEYSGEGLDIPDGECHEFPLQVQPLQILVTRTSIAGFDRIEVKYRIRRPI